MTLMLGLLALQTRTIELSTLDLTTMSNGWGRPHVDASIEGRPLTLGGHVYRQGIGAHSPCRLNLKVDRAGSLDATVGVDDETHGNGAVEFLVMIDGKVRWRSGIMKGGDPAKDLHVDLTGAKTVSLVGADAGKGYGYAHADWAEARITTEGAAPVAVRDLRPIRIETRHAALSLYVDDDGRLFQRAFGSKNADEPDGQIAFPAGGDGWTFEPALNAIHADGNTSTDLRVIGTSVQGDLTRISLKDPQYPFFVDLLLRAYPDEDVIETWTEIRHQERGEVLLDRFASSSLDLGAGDLRLTQFHGNWASEMQMQEEPIGFGLKILDSKLGVRADQFQNPSFLLSRGGPAKEDSGEVIGGSLAWSGSFQFAFERLPTGRVRALCGMNPYGSAYHLGPNQVFSTPPMVWVWSGTGVGQVSRNLHRWARRYVLREGDKPRAVLLNNWESTYFSFNAKKLVSLFGGAKALGMELFLLDDGWFGSKYPRNDDTQGLGDWVPDRRKLPNGIGELTHAAAERGIRFGLWVEPEMVSPRSELFETHPDWAIQQPKRPLDLQRSQLVLDLSNPKVEEHVYGILQRILTENPGISYLKWDCNRYLTQPGSTYLPKDRQTHLQIDYVHALYRIMDRLTKSFPKVEVMTCSGGGGRVDFGSLKFAHEFWPSDMTDPAQRILIQWGYSYIFPVMACADHVTLSGGHGLKFAFDVAMSGTLGMDIDVDKLSSDDRAYATHAIAAYKSIRDEVQLGDLYRLESPYEGPRSSMLFVKGDRAAVFVYSLGKSLESPLHLNGLDPERRYRIREINVGSESKALETEAIGRELIEVGLSVPAMDPYTSRVFSLVAE